MSIIGDLDIPITTQGINVIQNMKVVNTKTYQNVILGRDFLAKFSPVEFDFIRNCIKLGDKWYSSVKFHGKERVRLQSKVSLASRSECVINVQCKKSVSLITADFDPIQIQGCHGVYATRCRVVPNIDGVFQITLLNVNPDPVVLHSRKYIGNLHNPINTDTQPYLANNTENLDFESGIVHGEGLPQEEKQKLISLITKFSDVFASNPRKPSLVKTMEHRIITGDAQPVRQKPRRIPQAWNSEVNDQIQEMLENDIIRPSSSPWNAPIILVKKKDNSMRFVCDFRGLNDVTKKDSYPLPHIRDVIDKMEGARFWSTLDAASAYWSMPLAEDAKEKTAFSVPRGKFEFNVTPYGLCNAGASYQRMIDITLSGLQSDRILAYMDDIVIFSKTFEGHLENLEQIFQRLRSSGISLKLSKCVFASEQVNFLGFSLSREGIKPQSRLTDAIEQFQCPSNKKELKGFLGLAGFYRAFIPNFANISQPLNELTGENVPFQWSTRCENAFVTLKKALSSEPVLKFPDFGQEFIVEVDASNYAVGGVLSQFGADKKLHPVAYFSTALQKSQQNWSATTKEAFALVLAVRHWNVYLAGTKFTLNSDHNPLTFLRTQKDPRGKIGRWIFELEEFDYTIRYIRGKDNVKADALSRNYAASQDQPEPEFEDKVYAAFVEDMQFNEQLRSAQSQDPVLSKVTQNISNGEPVAQGRLKRVQAQLRIHEGILTKSGRPIVPPALRKLVVSKYHNVAHFGTAKVYALLKKRFYWPNMYSYIQAFTSACTTCQKSKCDTTPPKAPLLPMFVPNAPMQFVSLDIGYLPTDNSGYQYILLIGDVFSKFIQAVPLKDQTAPTIVDAFLKSWLYIHGMPYYLLTDQGSNVDGEVMKEICNSLSIEKRRSSAYHSQGNGFAERNIRTVKDMLRAVLLHRRMPQTKWRSVLPELVFALNASESKATHCVPFDVVFGRHAVLPQDIMFDLDRPDQYDQISVGEYQSEVSSVLKDVFAQVVKTLQLNKQKMQQQYNRNLRFIDYAVGQKVWLKVKHYKTGENRKLAPRRDGPWTVLEKLPNGVNFKIENLRKERKVVHHDRLLPIVGDGIADNSGEDSIDETMSQDADTDESNDSDYSPSGSEQSEQSDEDNAPLDNIPARDHPRRQRLTRNIPGTIPWDVIRI